MTAFDLIDSIFSRPSWGSGIPNVRRVTREQLKYLRDLIAEDLESEKAHAGAHGSLIWMPSGPHKYVLTEDQIGEKHTLTRLSNVAAQESPRLFL